MPWRSWAVGVMALCTAVGGAMRPHFSPVNLTMVYLVGVAWVATRFSRGPAIFASILAIAAFDFLFVPPYYRFAVADAQYLVTFAVMLAVAILISSLTERVRRQAVAARTRYLRTIALYFMSRMLAAAVDTAALVRVASRHIGDVFEGEAVLSMGKTIDFAKRGASGVVNIMPFTCMPGTIVSTLLKRYQEENSNIPILNMAYDGQEQTNTLTRLEAFMYQAKEFQSRKNNRT